MTGLILIRLAKIPSLNLILLPIFTVKFRGALVIDNIFKYLNQNC